MIPSPKTLRRMFLAAASLAFAAGMLAHAVPEIRGIGDVNLYHDIGRRIDAVHAGTRASVQSEYPPLASSVFWIVSRMPFPFETSWALCIFIALSAAVAYASIVGKETDAPAFVLAVFFSVQLLSVDLGFGRFDIFVAMLLVSTWISFRQGLYGASAFFLTLAAMLKVVPIFILPFLLAAVPRTGTVRAACGAAAAVACALGVSVAVLHPAEFVDNASYFLRYHAERGVQHESGLSGLNALLLWFRGEKPNIVFSHGTLENASIAPFYAECAKTLILVLLSFAFMVAWRRRSAKASVGFDTLMIAALLWMLSFSPVLSPQYFMWVFPLLVFWCVDRMGDPKWRPSVMIAFGATTLVGWLTYLVYKAGIEKGIASLIALHNLRNLILLCFAAYFYVLYYRGKPGAARARTTSPWTRLTLATSCAAVFTAAAVSSQPSVTDVRYARSQDAAFVTGALPVSLPSDGPDIFADVTMELPVLHPVMFRVKPDDCLLSLTVNGERAYESVRDFCDYGDGRDMDLGKYLRRGTNEFSFHVHDEGGGLGGIMIAPSKNDPIVFGTKIVFALLMAWLAYAVASFPAVRSRAAFWIPMFAGGVVRVLYAATFNFHTRGHDTDGHVEYIRYVADHLALPAADAGWEFHQAPLYYVVTGAWLKIASFAGYVGDAPLSYVQLFSLACSLASLGLSLWIIAILFGKKTERRYALAAGMIVATLPSFVFMSVRISNDVLYQPLALLTFACLARWWTRGRLPDWYAACAAFSFAFLAKISALAFVPLMFVLFFFRSNVRWGEKIGNAALSALLVVSLAGWFPAYRLFIEPDTGKTLSLGNDGMSGDLGVDNLFRNFATFNPAQVLRIPYNNPWNDESRRSYYWEYLYRSAFYGEFSFDGRLRGVSVAILFFGFGACVLSLAGFLTEAVRSFRRFLPSGVFLFLLLLSSFLYRWKFTYAPNQDFRFIVIAIVPLAYFAARGAQALGRRSDAALAALWLLSVLCAAFDLMLFVYSHA